ncbi:uncharacterized protein LOC123922627 [Trifolium pratense]|uniref:uncharacterized protein LOC123922627 n=1 Tax=Trifolium pratense TaxID=57577 RepID=UPI001E697A43|nr:uncharacterized protein LOC123922627 [Trifolium pratense]
MASLGRPFRSPPSPEARQKRWVISVIEKNGPRNHSRSSSPVSRSRSVYEYDRRWNVDRRLALEEEGGRRRLSEEAREIGGRLGPGRSRDHMEEGRDRLEFVNGMERAACDSAKNGLCRNCVMQENACDLKKQEKGVPAHDLGKELVNNDGVVRSDSSLGNGGVVRSDTKIGDDGALGTALKRYVSFYFTNFPAQMSNFYLRKGFEVCGVLEDVFVAKKRNRYGKPYGFVRFSNVKNVTKLTNALNNVWFGYFRVKASVAMFERNDSRAGKFLKRQKDGMEKGVDVQLLNAAKQHSVGYVAPTGWVESNKSLRKFNNSEDVTATTVEKDRSDPLEGVQVGEVIIKLGARQEDLVKKAELLKGKAPTPHKVEQQNESVKESRVFMRSYHSKPDDMEWAHNGVVATVFNGESIPVVQNRILDAGFNDLVLIPMGADKVFVRSTEKFDAMATINNAKEFFQLVFANWTRWENESSAYRRGAWVRLYGVPLHAWNEQFFQLCVFESGRFLRTDCVSVGKNRLDFARVLIATPELDIIKSSVTVLVDGIQVEIKIAEEGGYTMGEDSCLFDEESESEESQADCGEDHVDPEVYRSVEILVDRFKEGLEEEEPDEVQGMLDKEIYDESDARPVSSRAGTPSVLRKGSQDLSGVQDVASKGIFWLFMQGRKAARELVFDPEIEKTAKANRKAVRLAREVARLAGVAQESSF